MRNDRKSSRNLNELPENIKCALLYFIMCKPRAAAPYQEFLPPPRPLPLSLGGSEGCPGRCRSRLSLASGPRDPGAASRRVALGSCLPRGFGRL